MAKAADEVGTPPYLPWVTFVGFLRQIKGNVPTRVDSTVLKGRSGSDQSGIKTALRFMDLIGPDDATTKSLSSLVSSMDTDQWKLTLGELMTDAYLDITREVDMDNGTLGELQEAFSKHGGVTASVRDKAIRFYLTGMREAGLSFSTHFGGPTTSEKAARTGPRKPRKPRSNGTARDDAAKDETPADDVKEVRFPVPGSPDIRIWLPVNLTEGQWGMLDTYIRAFIKLRSDNQ